MTARVGYIGLGVMGAPFAGHLAAAGHAVIVYDRAAAAMERAAAAAALTPVDSVAAAAEGADVLFTCLPHQRAVEEVYTALDQPGLLCCDNSTIGPTLAKSLHRRLAERGMQYVECPMLGGVDQARAGELYLLLSGDADAVARVLPLAAVAARGHCVVGGPGTASLFKTVQNGLGHVQATAIAEALVLVTAAGGDVDKFIDVVGAGGGMAATPLFRARAPMMRDPGLPAKGALHIAAKDIGLAAALAEEHGVSAPFMTRAAAVYAQAMKRGLESEDMATIARVVEDETGVRIAREEA